MAYSKGPSLLDEKSLSEKVTDPPSAIRMIAKLKSFPAHSFYIGPAVTNITSAPHPPRAPGPGNYHPSPARRGLYREVPPLPRDPR